MQCQYRNSCGVYICNQQVSKTRMVKYKQNPAITAYCHRHLYLETVKTNRCKSFPINSNSVSDDTARAIRKLFILQTAIKDVFYSIRNIPGIDKVSQAMDKVASSAQSLISDTQTLKKSLSNSAPAEESERKDEFDMVIDSDAETVPAPSSDEEPDESESESETDFVGQSEPRNNFCEEENIPLPKPRPTLTCPNTRIPSPIRFIEDFDSIYGKMAHPRITNVLGGAPRRHYYNLVYQIGTRMIIGCTTSASYPRIIPLKSRHKKFVEMEIPQFFYVPVEANSKETVSHC